MLIHPVFPSFEDDEEKLSFLILTICIVTFANLSLYFILQKRELKRFLQQREADLREQSAIIKEKQLTQILNH